MTDRFWHPRWSQVTLLALLAIHAGLAMDTARRKSVTVDEVAHLPAGISYWQTGTFELYHHNPPLVKLAAAVPALALRPNVDYNQSWSAKQQWGMPRSPWAFGWEFMYANAERYAAIYFWSRLPVIALSLAAGLVIYSWSRDLFGVPAGLMALALWTFCPNVIAHASLVTTDIGAAAVGFIATYAFWRYLRCPSWRQALICGVCLGAAQLTKFSLLPLYGLWPLLWVLSRGSTRTDSARQTIGQLAALGAVSVLVINIGYGFEGTMGRLGDYTFISRMLTRPRDRTAPPATVPVTHPWYGVIQARQNRFVGSWLAALPVPLPRHYVAGFDEQKLESEGVDGQGYPVYLCGEMRRTGWWWYYFFALAIKVPVGTWIVTLAAAVAAMVRPAARARFGDEIVLLAPIALTLFVMSFLTDINLGVRYVLPIFPFWFVALGRVAVCLPAGIGRWSIALGAVLGWNALAAVLMHPHHLAYFNEFVGGPARGHRYLIDSNLDWGQDLRTLDHWLRENRPGEHVGLAYFGNMDPSTLAASGGGFEWSLAPPRTLGEITFVAARRGSPFAERQRRWMESHAMELREWLAAEHARGNAPHPNEHPAVRAMMVDELGIADGPQPGLYAISVNMLMGLPFRVRDQAGNLWNARQDAFAYFRRWTPIARVGHSIWVFDVSPEQADAAREELGLKRRAPGAGR